MDKKFGYYVFGGLIVGALFGLLLGSANQNPLMGAAIGALVGVAIGWFAAAAFLQNKIGKG